jgi:6-phosphogluconolactonase
MTEALIVVAPEQFAATAAATIAELILAAVAARGRCALALCGGSTPEPVYRLLGHAALPWPQIHVFFGDERAVPPGSPDSNYGLARRALLDHVPLRDAQVHRMPADEADRSGAAAAYAAILPEPLDVLLLGVGPDGHTASLFPGAAAAGEKHQRVLAVAAPPPPLTPAVARMTITPPVILSAREVVTMVRGAEKAAVLHEILDGPERPAMLPAQLARRGIWIIDQVAAAQLQQRDQ